MIVMMVMMVVRRMQLRMTMMEVVVAVMMMMVVRMRRTMRLRMMEVVLAVAVIMMMVMRRMIACLLIGYLTSQQHASVSQGRICSDSFMCCHTEIEVAGGGGGG